jgi:hypothetical protein
MNPPVRPCPIKGCPWRGPDPEHCPMHEDDVSSDTQELMMPADIAYRRNTRHR